MNTHERERVRRRPLRSDARRVQVNRTGILVIRGLLAAMAWLGLVGCEILPVACTPNVEPGVSVLLTDEQGAPIEGAVLTLASGTFSETLQELGGGYYIGAEERPGTYDLSITAEGFAPMTVQDVVVAAAPCHVVTADVQLTLTAATN